MIAYLQGGLGNQMFQYAAGLGAAKKLRCELIINNSFYKDHKQRQYELGVFPISAQTWGNVTGEPIKEKHFEYQEITTNGIKTRNIIGNIPLHPYLKPKGGPRRDRL